MERDRTDLEQQADEHHAQPDHQDQRLTRLAGDGLSDLREGDGSCVAVHQRGAVEEERRRESAEQEVLQRRLLTQQPASARHARHQVERERHDLQTDEHDEKVIRGDEKHHPENSEKRQGPDLGLQVAALRELLLLFRSR